MEITSRVVVHRFDLSLPVDVDLARLSEHERARSAGMRAPVRQRFLRRRTLIRSRLAELTGADPATLVLEARCERCGGLHPASPLSPGGAPAAHPERRPEEPIWWSSSSSGELALLAIAPGRVGIDVEAIDERRNWRVIARRGFLPAERAAIGDDIAAFFEYWTLKEAYLKALGLGLAGKLSALDCAHLRRGSGTWRASPANPGWSFASFPPQPGYVVSVALEAPGGEIEIVDRTSRAGAAP